MSEGRMSQKRDELVRFKATALYEDIVDSIQQHRRNLTVSLITAALRSHDPNVRAIAETLRMDTIFERYLADLDPGESVPIERSPVEDKKMYRDYDQLIDMSFIPDQEY